MMILLLSTFFLANETIIELPEKAYRPRVFWEDLDRDGTKEIWVSDRLDQLWIYHGEPGKGHFEALTYEPMTRSPKPARLENGWYPTVQYEGYSLHFEPEQGWQVHGEPASDLNLRPGNRAIDTLLGTFLPTWEGYELIRDGCFVNRFKVAPAVEVDDHSMNVTYPIPKVSDLNDDGHLDVYGAPIAFQRQGQLGIWTAIKTADSWESRWSYLNFPPTMSLVAHQSGDLDGDGHDELVILARPAQDMSIFEEMSFFLYAGKGNGAWEPTAQQELKTKQNLWQIGPMEISSNGIVLYYYKGLIRSLFKIDRYVWKQAGYLEPKPLTSKWKIPEADRGAILTSYDLNGDDQNDLILAGEEGLRVYYRQKGGKLPFTQKNSALISSRNFSGDFEMDLGPGELSQHLGQRFRSNRITRRSQIAIVENYAGKAFTLWRMSTNKVGRYQIKRMNVKSP